MAGLRGRLILPHQTQIELYRQSYNGALHDVPSFGLVDAIGRIENLKKATLNEIDKVRPLEIDEVSITEDQVSKLRQSVEAKFDDLVRWHENVQRQVQDWLGDPIDVRRIRRGEIPNGLLQEIAEVFGDKYLLGAATPEVQERWMKEYQERVSRDDPLGPGASDARKSSPADAAGDYIMWQEAVAYCKKNGANKGFFFVTEEKKKDYWETQQDPGALRRLNPEIQRETIASTEGPMLMINFEQFTRLASPDDQSFDSKYSQIIRDTETSPEPWPREAYHSLVAELERSGGDRQLKVILSAAARGGYISREEIGEVLEWNGENRYLTRFRMPADRVKKQLVSDGAISETVEDPLVAVYDGPGESVGYTVPAEFSDYYENPEQPVVASESITEAALG